MKTLIIDDDYDVRDALKHILQSCSVVEEADDGLVGMKCIVDSYDMCQPYSLILLDVVLPELDGFTLIRHVRYLEESYDLPIEEECKIIVITERFDEPTVLEAISLGATGIIQKPIDRANVLAGIKRFRCC